MATKAALDRVLNDTVGCMFIGVIFELIFYGLSLAQTGFYFHEYPKDRLYIRLLVAFIWFTDTARTLCDLQFLWTYLVTSHANLDGMSSFTNSFVVEFFLAAFIVFIVQLYYIFSIWHFIQLKWYRFILTIPIVALALLSFAGGIVCIYEATRNPDLAVSLGRMQVPASIQTVAAVVTDVYIAVALSVILHGKKTGFSGTNSLLTMLVAFAIHRGILTATLQLLHFATYIGTLQAGANKLYWALFHFPGGKVYTNSLLAVLNIRHWLRTSPERGYVEGIELTASENSTAAGSQQLHVQARRIHVKKEVYSDLDPLQGASGSKRGY